MRETFRALVVISTLIYLVYWFLPFVDWRWYSLDVLELRELSGIGAQLLLPLAVEYILFAAWILAAVGMYFFKAIARSAFLWLYIVSTLMEPFLGVVVLTGLDSVLSSLSTVLDGAIIAIAYLTSVERQFVLDVAEAS